MSVTIDDATFDTLTAQPFGYDEVDTRIGQTARKWAVTGLLKPSDWLSLLDVYDDWRDARINDEDTVKSGVVGTTIVFSGSGPGGQTWTNVPCWFSSAPTAEQSGAYLTVSVELVDAAQSLEVLLRQEELSSEEETITDLGTVTLGSAVLQLLKPMDTYGNGPQAELTATGVHYITGPLVVEKIREIEGTTNSEGWDDVRSWYESQIVAVPLSGSWFPVSPPTATAEDTVTGGVKTTKYTVSIRLALII